MKLKPPLAQGEQHRAALIRQFSTVNVGSKDTDKAAVFRI